MGLVQPNFSFISRLTTRFLNRVVIFLLILNGAIGGGIFSISKNISNISSNIEQTHAQIEDLNSEYDRLNNLFVVKENELEQLKLHTVDISESEIREVFDYVAQTLDIKGVSFPNYRFINRDKFAEEFRASITENAPDEDQLDTLRIFLQTFGYIDSTLSNQEVLQELVESQIQLPSAFYSPEKQELSLITGISSSKIYYLYNIAHEITHHFQDQKYGISAKKNELSNVSSDAYLSYMAIVEGHADYIATQYVNSLSENKQQELYSALKKASISSSSKEISLYDRLRSAFIYSDGIKFISYHNGNNTFLSDPTIQTTSQILHPENINKKETKLRVNYQIANYLLKEDDALGEFGCKLILNAMSDRHTICNKWNGDVFRIYKRDTSFVVIWIYAREETIFTDSTKHRILENLPKTNKTKVTSQGNNLILYFTNDPHLNINDEVNKIKIEN